MSDNVIKISAPASRILATQHVKPDAAPKPPQNIIVSSNGLHMQVQDDGSVQFIPAIPTIRRSNTDPKNFAANLAEDPAVNLGSLAEELLQGIQADEMSRADLIATYNRGVDLLGTKIEEASTQGRGSQKGSLSKIGHPLLLQACVEFQSQATGEMLPAAGPVKIQTIGNSTAALDQMAQDFETDFNYFLTEIAKEYYPDTRRALFYEGFGGTVYKKIYRCPIRRRPTSESVYLTDLIVNDNATDLDNALRVTHRIYMDRVQMRRMQALGRYIDTNLGQPMGISDPATLKIRQNEGLAAMATRPQDQPYTIYECDCYLVPSDYGLHDPLADPSFPIPYKVTIERDTRTVLAIWRNWRQGDDMFIKRNMYVKYGLIPGLGFHDYGFLHLLGNSTRVLRQCWRVLVDAGIYSNFPGGIKAKTARMSTNEISPGPGEWVDVDGIGDDIRKLFMPMPYKDPSAVFIQLMQEIGSEAKSLGASVEMEVGEGRANVPVGTIMAMIEQQTRVMAAVHKGNHTSQKDELCKLRELFAENPADLTRLARNPARQWETADEFMSLDLMPASDPNVPSQTHRIMQATGLVSMLGTAPPGILDARKIYAHAFKVIGLDDNDFMLPPQPPQAPPPDPKMITAQATAAEKQAQIGLDQQESQRKAAEAVSSGETKKQELAMQVQAQQAEAASRERIAALREQTEREVAASRLAEAQRHNPGFGGAGFGDVPNPPPDGVPD